MHFLESLKTKFLEERNHNRAIAAGFKPLDKKQYSNYNKFRPNGPKQIFCYLPYNSLTFSFGGRVYVCSYNRDITLGKYPQNSIKEIWEGEKAKKLREHMSHNDLEYGCRHCKFFFDKGKFSNIRPLVFDKYYQHTNADYPRVLEFEIDNKCNLECQMCNGEVSSSVRKNRDKLPPLKTPYDDDFVKQLEEYIPTLQEAKFYGGEPFMIPIYRKIWKSVKELNPKLDMFAITNGSLWNNEIETLVNELNFDIAISIDALDKEILEKIRKNVHKETLIENIHRFNEVCLRKKRNLSLSFTIQKDNWTQLPKHVEFCNSIDAYAYISYLENPKEFSILELPQNEIEKIRSWMENFSFPSSNTKEKYNKRCFEDYKNYLDAYLKNINEPRYDDYEFIPEEHFTKAQLEEKIDPYFYVDKDVTVETLLNKINSQEDDSLKKFNINEIEKKLIGISNSLSEEDMMKFAGMINEGSLIETLENLNKFEEEEIIKISKENFPMVVFRNK
jgi:radical SAM protein with 4Fe4S-binding SPASM domain